MCTFIGALFCWQVVLIVLFSALIAFGAAGNGLVCYVVIANAHMRTPRNLLILNLALSDLILCLFTQPFNLMKVQIDLSPSANAAVTTTIPLTF